MAGTDPTPTDWSGIHSCWAGCPCQTGGQPVPDFVENDDLARRPAGENKNDIPATDKPADKAVISSDAVRLREGLAARGITAGRNPDGVDDSVEVALMVIDEQRQTIAALGRGVAKVAAAQGPDLDTGTIYRVDTSSAHGMVQTARGMCSDEEPYEKIDALLGEAVERIKDLEDEVAHHKTMRLRGR